MVLKTQDRLERDDANLDNFWVTYSETDTGTKRMITATPLSRARALSLLANKTWYFCFEKLQNDKVSDVANFY